MVWLISQELDSLTQENFRQERKRPAFLQGLRVSEGGKVEGAVERRGKGDQMKGLATVMMLFVTRQHTCLRRLQSMLSRHGILLLLISDVLRYQC